MRKTLRVIGMCMLLAGCGNDKTIDGVTYGTYGLFNEASMHNPNIEYELSPGSIICAIIFSETIIVPIIVVGWDLFQPVGKVNANPAMKGVVRQ